MTNRRPRSRTLASVLAAATLLLGTVLAATSTSAAHYHLLIRSTSYPAHTYTLSFKVTGDPVTHTIKFVI